MLIKRNQYRMMQGWKKEEEEKLFENFKHFYKIENNTFVYFRRQVQKTIVPHKSK